jgi:putative copper resistance protein D
MSTAASVGLPSSGAALSLFGLVLMAATMTDVPIDKLDRATLVALLEGTAIGTAGMVRVGALLIAVSVSFLLKARSRSRWALQSFLGAVALGSLAWTGHGAADEGAAGWGHLAADIVHLLASGVWVGALVGLLVLLLRAHRGGKDQRERIALAHSGLVRFGTVGTLSVALILLTGLVNGWFLVGVENIPSLLRSLYGRLLVVKLLLFAVMLCLAALNRFRLTPAIKPSPHADPIVVALRSIKRSVTLESGLALTVLALVAWLGTLSPPLSG